MLQARESAAGPTSMLQGSSLAILHNEAQKGWCSRHPEST
jgi:hypothetical protein